jgi:hypothetical protein
MSEEVPKRRMEETAFPTILSAAVSSILADTIFTPLHNVRRSFRKEHQKVSIRSIWGPNYFNKTLPVFVSGNIFSFTSYMVFKNHILGKVTGQNDNLVVSLFSNMFSGMFAGVISLYVVHPWSLPKVQQVALAMKASKLKGFDQWKVCYEGVGDCIPRVALYRGIYLGAYDTGKKFLPHLQTADSVSEKWLKQGLWAYSMSILAAVSTHPLHRLEYHLSLLRIPEQDPEDIRKRLLNPKIAPPEDRKLGYFAGLRELRQTKGLGVLLHGINANTLFIYTIKPAVILLLFDRNREHILNLMGG